MLTIYLKQVLLFFSSAERFNKHLPPSRAIVNPNIMADGSFRVSLSNFTAIFIF